MFLSREIKEKIKKATDDIIFEEKKKQELLSKNLDTNFLQELINRSNENSDLVITIYLKSGDKIVIQQQFKQPEPTYGYSGEELEIR